MNTTPMSSYIAHNEAVIRKLRQRRQVEALHVVFYAFGCMEDNLQMC